MNDPQWKLLAWAKCCSKMGRLLPVGRARAFLHHTAVSQANPEHILELNMNCLDLSSCSFSDTVITSGFLYCFA